MTTLIKEVHCRKIILRFRAKKILPSASTNRCERKMTLSVAFQSKTYSPVTQATFTVIEDD